MSCTLYMFPPERGSRQSYIVTAAPSLRHWWTRLLPMNPNPPVTKTLCPFIEGKLWSAICVDTLTPCCVPSFLSCAGKCLCGVNQAAVGKTARRHFGSRRRSRQQVDSAAGGSMRRPYQCRSRLIHYFLDTIADEIDLIFSQI